ncbi:hypothetical protein QVD17_30661 [Tagetes erecta]|uniref:TF-B3 domain-containing protein n=1 Tax=Tagetes erecta TaxID=13708 RepID=A0AAD8K315_TARER|nr:hypothetical protein QVD17_30661 [Tagetes erecta]
MAYSFFVTYNSSNDIKLELPQGFTQIFVSQKIEVGYVRIKRTTHIGWDIYLEYKNSSFYFFENWKAIFRHLCLKKLCIVVFKYVAKQAFKIRFYQNNQDLSIGNSFYHVLRHISVDSILSPTFLKSTSQIKSHKIN